MWDRMLTVDAVNWMKNRTFEEPLLLYAFFDFLRNRVIDYRVVVKLALEWSELTPSKQASQALYYAGGYHASRFILFMDYLVYLNEKGELEKWV